jgi:hypothetical protein
MTSGNCCCHVVTHEEDRGCAGGGGMAQEMQAGVRVESSVRLWHRVCDRSPTSHGPLFSPHISLHHILGITPTWNKRLGHNRGDMSAHYAHC